MVTRNPRHFVRCRRSRSSGTGCPRPRRVRETITCVGPSIGSSSCRSSAGASMAQRRLEHRRAGGHPLPMRPFDRARRPVDASVHSPEPAGRHHAPDRARADAHGISRCPRQPPRALTPGQLSDHRRCLDCHPAPGPTLHSPAGMAGQPSRGCCARCCGRAPGRAALPSRVAHASGGSRQRRRPSRPSAAASPAAPSAAASGAALHAEPSGSSSARSTPSGSPAPRAKARAGQGREGATAGCCRAFASAARPAWSAACAGRGSASGASRGGRSRRRCSRARPPSRGWRSAPCSR